MTMQSPSGSDQIEALRVRGYETDVSHIVDLQNFCAGLGINTGGLHNTHLSYDMHKSDFICL